MLKRIISFFRDKGITLELLNILLSLIMLVGLLIYGISGKNYALYLVIACGALMNVENGFIYYRKRDKKNLGLSMIVFGICIALFFIIFLALGMI